MPCLVWETPAGRQVFDLSRAVLIVGRDVVADLVVEDATVSRRHALLQNENGVIRITDLGSSSGTKINGAKLTPDLPSSLEPGDFIQIGRLVFTYHHVAPPAATPRGPPRGPPPAAEAAPTRIVKARPAGAPPAGARAPGSLAGGTAPTERNVWKWVALSAAFVLVAVIGALVAVIATKSSDDTNAPDPASESRADVSGEELPSVPVPDQMPDQKPDPKDPSKDQVDSLPPKEPAPKEQAVERAPIGELPPSKFCSPSDFPDRLELDGDRFFPVRITTWDGTTLNAIGIDGRAYDIPQESIRRSVDRIDLSRRAARSRAKLDPSDVLAHLDLAKWCANRLIKSETRTLAKRVLMLRPNDPEATRLLSSTE